MEALRIILFYGGDAATEPRERLLAWLREPRVSNILKRRIDARKVSDSTVHSGTTLDERVREAIEWADVAIALITPDPRSIPDGAGNVIEEIGRWREKKGGHSLTIILHKSVKAHSNIDGTLYIDYRNHTTIVDECKDKLLDFLQTAIPSSALEKLPLAQMPTDRPPIPDYGALPTSGSQPFPFLVNRFFEGRDHDLQSIAHQLKDPACPRVAITGIPGIGKTQLASEFAHRYGRYFASVFWINGNAVPNSIAAYAQDIPDVPMIHDRPIEQRIKAFRQYWERQPPCLVIIDSWEPTPDLDLATLLTTYLPGTTRVIITTYVHLQTDLVYTIRLMTLDRSTSKALLQKHYTHLPDEVADAIATELGDLPLALRLAGSYLQHYARDVTPEMYLAGLRSEDFFAEYDDYLRDVARTFQLSYTKLQSDTPVGNLAQQILIQIAYLAVNTSIPMPLLRTLVQRINDDQTVKNPLSSVTRHLISCGLLIEVNMKEIQLHPLLARFVQEHTQPTHPRSTIAVQVAETLLIYAEDHRLSATRLMVAHLDTLITTLNNLDETPPPPMLMARLHSELAYSLNQQGDTPVAAHHYTKAIPFLKQQKDLTHPTVAQTLCNLAAVLTEDEIVPSLLQASLTLSKRVLGADHPQVAMVLNGLGRWSWSAHDYRRAYDYFVQAYKLLEATPHQEWKRYRSTVLANLAQVARADQDYQAAETYLTNALTLDEGDFGSDHPRVAQRYLLRGQLAYERQEYRQATQFFQKALDIQKAFYEDDDSFAKDAILGLANALTQQGRWEEARSFYRRYRDLQQERP